MKLSNWAKQQGISYKTAYNWFKSGKMPCRTEQLPTGTILVYPNSNDKSNTHQCSHIYTGFYL